MTPERWQLIEEVFHEASDLDGVARIEFLDDKCADDPELRSEVEQLLSQYEQASSFIEQPIINSTSGNVLANLLDESDADPLTGKVLGSYRIEREIGRGGMGAVYEAVRADGEFRLRVAVKVVKRGVDTDFVLRRFRNERQILAALDHQFITRLIDGGTTDDGRPYFVMEYIDGLPLYRYCDREKLGLVERLNLFSRICEAVEYAHQRRVIHRDLKPSNIFITNDGNPRLLDFGIAKLLDPDLAIDTLQPTATALRMMTVDYASPEQIRGDKVTFATDIYSLGVILFELLTGYRPYSFASRSPHDVARTICDEEPLMPSAAGLAVGATPVRVNPNADTLSDANASKDHGISSSELVGNLDRIILQALRKEPSERYGSVEKLRLDIQAHIDGEKVDAAEIGMRTVSQPLEDEPDSRSVAVLPLTLLSPTGEETTDEAYLTVGVADAIITRLTAVQRLTVRPTSSITRYSDREINPFRAGAELGVDYVLDGRIRRFGERIRISLQLLDVRKIKTIWAGHFDEHLTDVLELEDAISEQVATSLIPHLTGEDMQKLSQRGTNDPQAHEAYLRGRFHWNQFTSDSLPKALDAYETAVKIDPKYALAHAAIAEFYIWAGIYGLIPTVTTYRNAWDSVHRALSITPDLAEAHSANALLLANEFRWESAEASYLRSIELNPKYALAREWYGALLIGTGRFEEGLTEMAKAVELDPMSLRTKILQIWYLYQTHRFDEALAKANQVIAIDPNYPQGHLQKGNLLSLLGRPDESLESLERARQIMPATALVEYAMCFALARAGHTNDAVKLADSIEERAKAEFVKPYFIAMANFAVGRIDRAFELLEISVEERDAWLVWLGTEPNLKPFHNDERYRRALAITQRELIDGRARLLIATSGSATSFVMSEAETASLGRTTIAPFAPGFARRHAIKIGAAVVSAIVLIAYATGILSVSVTRDGGPSTANTANSIQKDPSQSAPAITPNSVVVLPFTSSDAVNNDLGVGLADSLTSKLGAVKRLTVVSANSGRVVAKKEKPEISTELGVQYILTSSIEKSDIGFRVVSELFDGRNGKQMWQSGLAVDAKSDELFTIVNRLGEKILEAISIEPLPVEKEQFAKTYTQNELAYELYLIGRSQMVMRSPESIRKAIAVFNRAKEEDPNFVLAYTGLADAYNLQSLFEIPAPKDSYPNAIENAKKALAIDSELAEAHVSLGYATFFHLRDRSTAELEFRRAIQINPSYAQAHSWFSSFLVATNRLSEAVSEAETAKRLDPMALTSGTGLAYFYDRQFERSIAEAEASLELNPNFIPAIKLLRWNYCSQGKYEEAKRAFQKERSFDLEGSAADWYMIEAQVEALSGNKDQIKLNLDKYVNEPSVRDNPNAYAYEIALAYNALGQTEKTFEWLVKAETAKSYGFNFLAVDHRLQGFRTDPRFKRLLQKLNGSSN